MAIEDFTGYTEVDPNSDLTVTAAKVAFNTMTSAVGAYLRADKGIAHFGDFEHLFSAEYTSVTGANYMNVGFWGMSALSAANTYTEMNTANDGLIMYGVYNGTNVQFRIKDWTNNNSASWTGGALGTQYWFTVKRVSTILTCKIYSDSGRTTLIDTLSLTCNSTPQQYVYGLLSQGSAGTKTATGFTENLDLQEAAGGITVIITDSGYGSDFPGFFMDIPVVDMAKGTEDLSLAIQMLLSDAAKGEDSLSSSIDTLIADTAKAEESPAVNAETLIGDAIKAEDIATLQFDITVADDAESSDDLTSAITTAINETALGSELLSLGINVQVVDDGLGDDILTIEVPVTVADSGRALEAVTATLAQLLGALSETLSIKFVTIERVIFSKSAQRDIQSKTKLREVKQ